VLLWGPLSQDRAAVSRGIEVVVGVANYIPLQMSGAAAADSGESKQAAAAETEKIESRLQKIRFLLLRESGRESNVWFELLVRAILYCQTSLS
jgi:hypothetical protein